MTIRDTAAAVAAHRPAKLDCGARASIVIFVPHGNDVDDVAALLLVAGWGEHVAAMSGRAEATERAEALATFKSGAKSILVATPAVARGLDVPSVDVVIVYRPLATLEDYVHAAGRAGRAGRPGCVYSFLVNGTDEAAAPILIRALEGAGEDVPPALTAMAALHARRVAARAVAPTSTRVMAFIGAPRDARHGAPTTAADKVLLLTGPSTGKRTRRNGDGEDEDDDASATAEAKSKKARAEEPPKEPADGGAGADEELEESLAVAFSRAVGAPFVKPGQIWGQMIGINHLPTAVRMALQSTAKPIAQALGVRLRMTGSFFPKGAKIPTGSEPLAIELIGDSVEKLNAARAMMIELMADHADRKAVWKERNGGKFRVV